MSFTQEAIDALRERVRSGMSEWRFNHTAEVEKMALRLGRLYAPDKLDILSAAALLHDITKEKSTQEQIEILNAHGVSTTRLDTLSPKTLHAKTAELIIRDEYPELATDEVCRAVRLHTTGCADMNVLDAIIYLADYIDLSRKFPDCIKLREYFWREDIQALDGEALLRHLWQTLLVSFDMTLRALIDEGTPIDRDTLEARNAMIERLAK